MLRGRSFSPPPFRIEELEGFDPAEVFRILRGETVGCIFRNLIGEETCKVIRVNFWNHPNLKRRLDGVPAHYLGAYHYGKGLDEYLDLAEKTKGEMAGLFARVPNIVESFLKSLSGLLGSHQIDLRLAQHEGRMAAPFVARAWSGIGEYVLSPHEDRAQLMARKQRGFEIQDVARYPEVAVNLCLENSGGGELHYWNIEPDLEVTRELGLEETGYPYPLAALEGVEKLVVPIRTGDLYFFNGKFIHAVAAHKSAAARRSTLSFLMGFKDPRTVIYWS